MQYNVIVLSHAVSILTVAVVALTMCMSFAAGMLRNSNGVMYALVIGVGAIVLALMTNIAVGSMQPALVVTVAAVVAVQAIAFALGWFVASLLKLAFQVG